MTCRLRFVRKKSQAPRQTQRKTRKLTVQTSSKKLDVTNTDERRGCSPMTAFPEFAIPADIALTEAKSPGVVSGERPGLWYSVRGDPLLGHLIDSDVRAAIRNLLRADPHAQVFRRNDDTLIISGISISRPLS
jgi:hypothetical protein